MKKHNIVYKLTNSVNNYIYIGVHETDKLDDNYMGSGTMLKEAQKEFGMNQFIKEVLFDYNNLYDMYKKEWELVDMEFINRPDTYNTVFGGQCNIYHNGHTNGSIFVFNDKDERIKIPLDSYEWQYGIYESCANRNQRLKHKGKRIYNPTTMVNNKKRNKHISLSDLKEYKDNGWIRGRNKSINKLVRGSPGCRKMTSPCNTKSEYICKEEIQTKLKEGWKLVNYNGNNGV